MSDHLAEILAIAFSLISVAGMIVAHRAFKRSEAILKSLREEIDRVEKEESG